MVQRGKQYYKTLTREVVRPEEASLEPVAFFPPPPMGCVPSSTAIDKPSFRTIMKTHNQN
jgi:hypothetical protein